MKSFLVILVIGFIGSTVLSASIVDGNEEETGPETPEPFDYQVLIIYLKEIQLENQDIIQQFESFKEKTSKESLDTTIEYLEDSIRMFDFAKEWILRRIDFFGEDKDELFGIISDLELNIQDFEGLKDIVKKLETDSSNIEGVHNSIKEKVNSFENVIIKAKN